MKSAFYAFNVVANWVYTRWNLMYPELHDKIIDTEATLHEAVLQMDQTAIRVLESQGTDACIETVTTFTEGLGTKLVNDWNTLFGELFVKYRDGYIITQNQDDLSCGCDVGNGPYPQEWYDDIAKSTGKHLEVPVDDSLFKGDSRLKPISKSELLARK